MQARQKPHRLRSPLPALLPVGLLLIAALLPVAVSADAGAPGAVPLRELFADPPREARPRVWWHWINGNVSREGIRADLEWMARSGIGGAHAVDIGMQSPVLVGRPLVYPGSLWREAAEFAGEVAERNDLEFGVFSSPGWSLTGGPGVRPQHAMKKLVWSSLPLSGPGPFQGPLPELPAEPGPFQRVPRGEDWLAGQHVSPPPFSADTVVIAYRRPAAEARSPERVHVDGSPVEAVLLADGDRRTALQPERLPSGKWPAIHYEYDAPVTLRSVSIAAGPPGTMVVVQGRAEGERFKGLARTWIGPTHNATVAFPAASVRALRFTFVTPKARLPFLDQAAAGASTATLRALWRDQPRSLEVFDLEPRGAARIHEFEAKAGFQLAHDYRVIATPPAPPDSVVPTSDVIDLSGRMRPGGVLDWDVPPGDWLVLRMGYSLTGATNHGAPPAGTGLEVDKLDAARVGGYLREHLATYGDLFGTGRGQPGDFSLMVDSYEVGAQNWTENILERFEQLRGYDPRPWLPALTGIIVGSAGQSDRFLWDFRATLAELLASEHYGAIADVAREYGLTLYVEALESMRTVLGDDQAIRRHADVPTGAMWTFDPEDGPGPAYVADIRGAASVANIYGRRFVGAEVFTSALSPWAYTPARLKPVADRAFASGMNLPIIHSSPHQPLEDAQPGFSMSIFGQQFSRHETWAEQSRPWIDYLARCSLLLQQGRAVADIAYFYGEDAPVTALFARGGPGEIPAGHDFDYLGALALLEELTVQDGDLVTASGMRYRLLLLGGDSSRMTLPVLRRLRELAAAGATIVGDRPAASPSLADDPMEFTALVESLWGEGAAAGEATTPRGIPARETLPAVLDAMELTADFSFAPRDGDLYFKHRSLPGGSHIYFVSNPAPQARSVEARFRVSGGDVEFWHPDSGLVEAAPYREQGPHTVVPLELDPFESLFVVFTGERGAPQRTVKQRATSVVATLENSWELVPASAGSDAAARPWRLASWHEDPHLKYFSGTLAYRTRFEFDPRAGAANDSYVLDLGDVRDLARVMLNGDDVATLWKRPFHTDITGVLEPGLNTLEVHVTNLWVNRLIGDSQPGATPRTVTNIATYTPDAPLRPAGLLGPVRLLKLSSSGS